MTTKWSTLRSGSWWRPEAAAGCASSATPASAIRIEPVINRFIAPPQGRLPGRLVELQRVHRLGAQALEAPGLALGDALDAHAVDGLREPCGEVPDPTRAPVVPHVAAPPVDDALGVRHGAAGEARVGAVLLGEEDRDRRRA